MVYKSDFAKLMTTEIETLKAKMLKLPTMSMKLLDNVLENIDEDYPFSLSPKLILALLLFTGIYFIAIGIIFIWYKRKTSLTSSIVGNLMKLVPSLNEKVPYTELFATHIIRTDTLTSNKNDLTPVAILQCSQTPPGELILLPVMVPKL